MTNTPPLQRPERRGQRSAVVGFLLFTFSFLIPNAHAFSLLGPPDAYANLQNGANWPTARIGYNVFNTDIGVPVNLGEEYRFNAPTLTYTYDQSFLNYFGQQGVNAIEGAIKILNDLPAASKINLDDYPTENKRLNGTAQNLGVMDLKSNALALLLELFGLAAPERFVWTLRARDTITAGGVTFTNYTVVMRNFDPYTLQPTNRVNGASYTYVIQEFTQPQDWADAFEFQIDPLEFGYSSVANTFSAIYNVDTNFSAFGLLPGEFFPGLTRDDVGGWRYLIRSANWNVEQTQPNTTVDLGPGAGGAVTNPPAPWTPILVSTNIATFTNVFGTNPPWTPFVQFTNAAFTNIIATNLTNFVDIALRPGVDKIRFRRVNFDSLLGQNFLYTNRYTDVVISNFTRVSQRLQRVQVQPDLIFAAGDLGVDADAEGPIVLRRGVNFVNNDAINGFVAQGGPGVLQGPMLVQFTDQLPAVLEQHGPNSTFILPFFVWGSFDETSDEVIVYPNSLSLQALEELIARSRRN